MIAHTNQRCIAKILPLLLLSAISCNAEALTPPSAAQIRGLAKAMLSSNPPSCPGAYNKGIPGKVVSYNGLSTLLSSQLISSPSVSAIQADQTLKAKPYLNLPLPNGGILGGFTPAIQGVSIYRIQYTSTTPAGNSTIVSGLVVFPQGSMSGGMVVYDHATQVSAISGAPSYPSGEACMIITAMGGKGRVIAMPDYLGFGVNKDSHPYALGIQNAPAGIDIITATRELAQQLFPGRSIGSPLFITGYSEGGGNALWLGRQLESLGQTNMQPTLMAPMSGNYDMTGATANSLIVDQPLVTVTLAAKPVLVAFAAQGAAGVSGASLTSLLQPSFAAFDQSNPLPINYSANSRILSYITNVEKTAFSLGYVSKTLNPDILMQSSLVSAIQTTNRSNPVVSLWYQNNDINWTPKAPIYATGILQDQIVPFAASSYPPPSNYIGGKPFFSQGNSENLISTMRSNGYGAAKVSWCGIDAEKITENNGKQETINHLTGVIPVSILAEKAIEAGGTLSGLPVLADPM